MSSSSSPSVVDRGNPAPQRCKVRSASAGKSMPHVYTSTMVVVGTGEKKKHCSWCWKQEP